MRRLGAGFETLSDAPDPPAFLSPIEASLLFAHGTPGCASRLSQNSAKTQSGLAPERTGRKPVPRTTPLKGFRGMGFQPMRGGEAPALHVAILTMRDEF